MSSPGTGKAGAATYEVDFAARVAPDGLRIESVPVPPEWNLPGDILELEGAPPDVGVESFLLPVDSPDQAAGARVSCVPASALSGVCARPAMMGTIAALQVIVDPRKAGAREIRIAIELPAGASTASAPRPSSDPRDAAFFRRFFLDGEALDAVPLASPRAAAKGVQSPTPPGEMRIDFVGEGLFGASLESLGLEESDVAGVALWHHGQQLRIGGVSDGNLWFHAAEQPTRYNRSDAVFVDDDAPVPSPTVATRPAFSTISPAGAEVAYPRSRRYERNLHYQQIVVLQGADHFAFHRAGAPSSSQTPASATHQLPFPDLLALPDVTITAQLIAQNQTTSIAPDHYTDLTVAGVSVPRFSWDGKIVFQHAAVVNMLGAPLSPQFSFTHAVPQAGDNPVVDGGGSDQQRFDWLQLDYVGVPRAENGDIAFVELAAAEAPRRATVGGFPAGTTADDVAVLDITDPAAPVRLTGVSTFTDSSGTIAVEFEPPLAACRFLVQRIASASGLAVAPSQAIPPLPAARLRGIHVRPDELAAALAPLVALRSPGIVEMSPRQAYDTFGGGRQDPQAIRDAVAWYLANAAEREPQPDVLLVGHGTLDPKGELGLPAVPEIPSFIEQSVETSPGFLENPVDYFFACVEGEDEIPDVRLGRIPAKTPEELTVAVDRARAHWTALPTLAAQARTGVFLAGSDNQGYRFTFIDDQPQWTDLWETTGLAHVRIDDGTATPDGAAEFTALKAAMENGAGGAAYVQYMGHGFINNWQTNQMMNLSRSATVATAGKWPLVATFTCFNGLYALPGSTSRSMVEAWIVLNAGNGATGAVAPVSVDFYFEQSTYTKTFLESIAVPAAQRPRTHGEWMAATQTFFATTYPGFFRTLHEFSFFGDPAGDIGIDVPPPGDAWNVR